MSGSISTPSFVPEEVKIGTQTWMAKNYDFGGSFPNDDPDDVAVFGKWYLWSQAMEITLPGWHLPTRTEIGKLILFLGGDSVAGGHLKEVGTEHYKPTNIGGDNTSGFTGLPLSSGDNTASFWTATESGTSAYILTLYYDSAGTDDDTIIAKSASASIRLIKDQFDKWTNIDWDTFTSDENSISSAIEGAGTSGIADSRTTYLINGTTITFTYNCTLNSGSYPNNAPQIHLYRVGTGIEATWNINPAFNGVPFIFTTGYSDYYKLQFKNTGTYACDCSCTFTISF